MCRRAGHKSLVADSQHLAQNVLQHIQAEQSQHKHKRTNPTQSQHTRTRHQDLCHLQHHLAMRARSQQRRSLCNTRLDGTLLLLTFHASATATCVAPTSTCSLVGANATRRSRHVRWHCRQSPIRLTRRLDGRTPTRLSCRIRRRLHTLISRRIPRRCCRT